MKSRALGVVGLCAVLTTGALAQPPRGPMGGRDGGPPRGGLPMRSAKGRLPRLVEGATRLSGAEALSKKQARRMIALVSPWKARPRMSETQAQSLLVQASGVLTPAQRSALEAERPGFGGGRGGPPPGGRDFGGGGRGGDFGGRGPRGGGGMQRPTAAQENAMRTLTESFNPLYTGSTASMAGLPERMQQGLQRRRDRLNAALSQLQQKAR